MDTEFIKEVKTALKPLSTSSELVNLGILGSVRTANNQRHAGTGIDYIKLPSGRVRYTKGAVIEYLRRSVSGSESN